MESPDPDQLPRAYRIGLRLHEMGADEDFIADCLGIDPAGVATLIEIGQQKLAAEQRSGRQPDLSDSDPDSTGC
jgi:hypothetical protein